MALTERLAILIEANGGKAIAEFKKVGAAAQGVEGPAGKGSKALAGLGQAGAAAGNMLKVGLVGGVAAAWGAIGVFAGNAVGSFATLAASIRDVQRITGGTAEEASKLVAILDDFEVPVEVLNKGFFRLAREIGKNDKAFADAGFQVAKNSKGNVDLSATLLNIADAYKATEDPAKRATLLTAAFGRGGAELIPILEQGRAKIEEVFAEAGKVGQIFSQDDLDSAEEYRLAMDDLHDATAQFSIEAGKILVPVLTRVAGATTNAIAKFKGLKESINESRVGKEVLQGIGGAAKVLGFGASNAADGLGDLEDAATEAVEAQRAAAAAVDGLTKSLYSLESAERAVDASVRASAAATRDLADKNKSLNELLKAGAVDHKAVAAATKDVTAAAKELTRAQKDEAAATTAVHDAEKVLADLRSGATAAKNMADHADDVGKAQLGVTRAEKRLSDAQDTLNELQRSGTATGRELSDAQDDVTSATFDLNDANANLITTQEEVNRLAQVGAENSPDVVAAHKTVETARDTLATATDGVATATANVKAKQDELGTALAGDPNYKDEVRAARQAVADATQHVADAMYNVAQNKAQFEEAKKVLDESVGAGGPNAVAQVKTNIEQLLAKKPELALFFDPVLADLAEVNRMINQGAPAPAAGGFAEAWGLGNLLGGALVPKRAAGGPINGLALVGEKGPELFAGHGTIIPNHALGGGGGTTVINVTVHAGIAGDADRVIDAIYSGLLRIKNRNGALGLN